MSLVWTRLTWTCSHHHRRIVLLGIQDEAYRYGRYYKYVFKRLHINLRRLMGGGGGGEGGCRPLSLPPSSYAYVHRRLNEKRRFPQRKCSWCLINKNSFLMHLIKDIFSNDNVFFAFIGGLCCLESRTRRIGMVDTTRMHSEDWTSNYEE